jgi:hypothetical protein
MNDKWREGEITGPGGKVSVEVDGIPRLVADLRVLDAGGSNDQ